MRTALPLAALAAATALVCADPPPARAGACCLSATAVGTGRLLLWEDFAVGLRTAVGVGVGHWTTDGAWSPYGDYEEVEARATVWGQVRLTEDASLAASVPLLMTWRRAGDVDAAGGGLGESTLAFRYELVDIGESFTWPGLALTVGLTAPGNRAMHASDASLAVDVTTRGAWVLAAGVSMERTMQPWFFRLDVGATVPLPMDREDVGKTQRYGPGLSTALAFGRQLTDGLVLALTARGGYESDIHLDEQEVPDSDRIDLGLTLSASWRFHPHWTLQAGVDTGVFVDGGGDNQPGRVTTSIGLRYGHF